MSNQMPSRRVAYILSEQLAKISSLLPSNKGRSSLVHQLAVSCGLLHQQPNAPAQMIVVKPQPVTKEALTAFHDEEYISWVLDPSPLQNKVDSEAEAASFGIEDDCPWFEGLHIYVPLIAGATLTATQMLVENRADVAISWDGGRHHAQKANAAGFCYVADIVLSLLKIKRAPGKPRIFYIDLDLHFSDGVSGPFANSFKSSKNLPQILTLSVHHAAPGFYPSNALSNLTKPDTSDLYTLSIPLKAGASSVTFRKIWESIERLKMAFDPGYIVVQCGVDGLAGDPMAKWNWTIDQAEEGSMGWCIQRILNWKRKTLLLGGGGYNSPNAARAWSYFTSLALEQPLLVDMSIPEHPMWPQYAPSFALEIEKGNMTDENAEEYITQINETIQVISERIIEHRTEILAV